jgi:spore coat polysaccharide biosynthesis protein SpsF (cytidylyltransferase family)
MSTATKVVAIVQARMGSTRTPGKSFERVGGVPVAELVLRRLARSRRVDRVVLATSDLPRDKVLADHAETLGFVAFRGAENDLVERFYEAAREHGATHVVRVCADNVFLDWSEIDRLVEYGLREQKDFVGFTNPTYPDRLNDFAGEFMTFEALERTFREATEPFQREHVYPYFYNNPDKFNLGYLAVTEPLRTPVKLDLDYPDDLALLREIGRRVPDAVAVPAAEVVRLANLIASEKAAT